jgi:hypothetical protein
VTPTTTLFDGTPALVIMLYMNDMISTGFLSLRDGRGKLN